MVGIVREKQIANVDNCADADRSAWQLSTEPSSMSRQQLSETFEECPEPASAKVTPVGSTEAQRNQMANGLRERIVKHLREVSKERLHSQGISLTVGSWSYPS